MYEIHFDPKAIEFLEKLPKDVSRRIYAKIISSKPNPFHFFIRLEGRTEYRLRVGDYRIIADIDQNRKLIEIIHIGHRKNVYNKI